MPVLAIFTGEISKEQYDALRAEVAWETRKPDGGVVHAAAFDDQGRIHVADVWDSGEAMNAFVQERLAPALQKLEITPPDVSVFPVHNLNAYETINAFMVD